MLISRLKQILARDHYRPEIYYMRGPGPKTLAKVQELDRARKP